MKETKEQKILWKILKEMYAVSNPPADFDQIIESAHRNEKGQKIVPFNDHEITLEKYDEIMEKNLTNQRLTKLKKQMIRNSVANFAPKFALLFLFFNSFCGFSQNRNATNVIEVYNYNNGIREITPSKIIEIKEEKIEIYNVQNDIKNIIPSEIIIDNKLYEVNESGLQELFPRYEIHTNSSVLPTIDNNRTFWNGLFILGND